MSEDKNKLGAEELQQIAHLARLKLNDDAIPAIAKNMSSIVDFVGQLDQVNMSDLEGSAPMAHPRDLTQRLRSDKVTETNEKSQRDHYQKCAPAVTEGMYLVPKVID